MRIFSFCGKSCMSMAADALILVSLDGGGDSIPGSSKKVITGETSVYKTIANEYGNKYDDVLTFTYSLIKYNGEPITQNEQRNIEKWLTSPRLSQYLQTYELECEDGDIYHAREIPVALYCGTFVETEWLPWGDEYMGVTFKFQCDSAYAWDFNNYHNIIPTGRLIHIYAEIDDTEDYIYPTISLTARNAGSQAILHDVNITMVNRSDEDRSFTLTTQIDKTVVMDCRTCRITDDAGNLFSYEDLGWEDVGNIYWPRMINGGNNWAFDSEDNIKIELDVTYMAPSKIVGGWLS